MAVRVGTLCIADPPWGLTGAAEFPGQCLFKLVQVPVKVEVVAIGLTIAKGINFSPDENRLCIMYRTSVDSTRMKNAGAEPIGAKS